MVAVLKTLPRENREIEVRDDFRIRRPFVHGIQQWSQDAIDVADELDNREICAIVQQNYDDPLEIGEQIKALVNANIDDVVDRR